MLHKHVVYKGLAKFIKDSFLHFPCFKFLTRLCNFTLEIDSRYWECKEYNNLTNFPQGSNMSSSNQSNPNQSNNQQSYNNSNNQWSCKGTNNNNSNQKSSNSKCLN